MKKILAFGASLSETSINQQLAVYAASIIEGVVADTLVLRDYYPMAMFGMQSEMPESAIELHNKFAGYDGFIISLAEHNGTYTAGFKNALDWLSTAGDQSGVFFKKPILIMGTSPGGKGAQFVIEAGKVRFPWNGAGEINTFSLPFFKDNFQEGKIVNDEKLKELSLALSEFVGNL